MFHSATYSRCIMIAAPSIYVKWSTGALHVAPWQSAAVWISIGSGGGWVGRGALIITEQPNQCVSCRWPKGNNVATINREKVCVRTCVCVSLQTTVSVGTSHTGKMFSEKLQWDLYLQMYLHVKFPGYGVSQWENIPLVTNDNPGYEVQEHATTATRSSWS